MNPFLLALPVAYLLGSIPFGYVLVRTVRKQDIRSTGSGNIGATNVLRSGAKGLGIATLLLDCGKGVLAVVIARVVASHYGLSAHAAFDLSCAAAIAAVLGHVFPVWLGFRGGKGVATALGVFLVLSPACIGCSLLVFLAVVLLSRYVSLASIMAAAVIPLAAAFFVKLWSPTAAVAFIGLPLLVMVKHHGNIRRLLDGTENRFGSKRSGGNGHKGTVAA